MNNNNKDIYFFIILAARKLKIKRIMKYRIYLDNCCFNRPYYDQSQLKIYLETQAKLYIQNFEFLNQIEI